MLKILLIKFKQLENAGADIVRVSCPDENSTKSLKEIKKRSQFQLLQIYIFITKELLKLLKWERAV